MNAKNDTDIVDLGDDVIEEGSEATQQDDGKVSDDSETDDATEDSEEETEDDPEPMPVVKVTGKKRGRGSTGRIIPRRRREIVDGAFFSTDVAFGWCRDVLEHFMNHPDTGPFRMPVSRTIYPDYYQLIKNPMDLGTVKEKLDTGKYPSVLDFLHDMRTVWANALNYNAEGSWIYRVAAEMQRGFQRCWSRLRRNRCRKPGDADPTTQQAKGPAKKKPRTKRRWSVSRGRHATNEVGDTERLRLAQLLCRLSPLELGDVLNSALSESRDALKTEGKLHPEMSLDVGILPEKSVAKLLYVVEHMLGEKSTQDLKFEMMLAQHNEAGGAQKKHGR